MWALFVIFLLAMDYPVRDFLVIRAPCTLLKIIVPSITGKQGCLCLRLK